MPVPMRTDPNKNGWPLRVLVAATAVMLSGGVGGLPAYAAQTPADSPPAPATADTDGEQAEFAGVDLGEYMVRTYYPIEAQKSVVSFQLHATVSAEDAAEFKHLLDHRRQRVRDQVIIATRLVPVADFNDPELASFRRRILLRLHRMLPELLIQDAYISDFQLEVESL